MDGLKKKTLPAATAPWKVTAVAPHTALMIFADPAATPPASFPWPASSSPPSPPSAPIVIYDCDCIYVCMYVCMYVCYVCI